MNVIFFKNFSEVSQPHTTSLQTALDRIKNGASKDKILEIRRKVAAGEDYEEDKKDLPCVLFSVSKTKEVVARKRDRLGNEYMTHREDGCATEHSGVFTLDWDSCDTTYKLEQLKKDPYILAAWLSPSGTGVRALVKCPPNIANHNLYYTAFLDRYPELDSTSRNISRVTFESYDPSIFINWNSLQWDKKLTEEQRKQNKEKEANKRGKSILSTAVAMVRASVDGEKHEALLKAANLVGGYVAAGRVNEDDALKILEEEIRHKNVKDIRGAVQTIKDGIAYGKLRPLAEAKKIEKSQQFLRREDGSFYFLADEEEMDDYLRSVIDGTLEMGLPTGLNHLNEHWMFKKHHVVWWMGLDNVGKSFVVWYLAVLAAKFHGWKIAIQSAENGNGQLRRKLMEFYLGKSVKLMDDEEIYLARQWVKDHFRIISSREFHTIEDFLLKCEILYDEGFEYDVVIAEPWNSFDMPLESARYALTIKQLNLLRVFKEDYSAVWVCDHVSSEAAKRVDKEKDSPYKGYILPPYKADVEMGQVKAAKSDDFIVIHRLTDHPYRYTETELHVKKIKDVETGGKHTPKNNPVIIKLNADYCGYNCNGIDPIKQRRV
jgi:hypothetical protein